MEVFQVMDFARLRSGRAYVHAAEDGRSVCFDPRGASRNAVRAVTPRSTTATHCVRGAYGPYLGPPDVTARGSLRPCYSPCRAAVQRDFDKEEILAILSRAVATSSPGVSLLHDASERYLRYLGAPDATARGSLRPCSSPCRAAVQRDFDKEEILAILSRAVATSRPGVYPRGSYGRYLGANPSESYLRANPRCFLPCRSRVSVSTCGCLGKAIQCSVEPAPRGGRPDIPRGRDSECRLCPPLARLCVRWFSLEREIRFVRTVGSCVFSEDNWLSLRYTGRATILLLTQLLAILPRMLTPHYTVYFRAGRPGQPSPLAINLPGSREPLDIILFHYISTGHGNLTYESYVEATTTQDSSVYGSSVSAQDSTDSDLTCLSQSSPDQCQDAFNVKTVQMFVKLLDYPTMSIQMECESSVRQMVIEALYKSKIYVSDSYVRVDGKTVDLDKLLAMDMVNATFFISPRIRGGSPDIPRSFSPILFYESFHEYMLKQGDLLFDVVTFTDPPCQSLRPGYFVSLGKVGRQVYKWLFTLVELFHAANRCLQHFTVWDIVYVRQLDCLMFLDPKFQGWSIPAYRENILDIGSILEAYFRYTPAKLMANQEGIHAMNTIGSKLPNHLELLVNYIKGTSS